jgi:hypothetical protein
MAALLSLACVEAGACRSSPAPITGGGGADGGQDTDAGCFAGRCACGSFDVAGTTPQGPFVASIVYADIEGSACPGYGSLHLGISDSAAGTTLGFAVPFEQDAGAGSLLGPHMLSITFATQTNPLLTTSGTVTITAADDPRAALSNYYNDGGIWTGMVAGSLTMSQDGFSISGTFTGFYCSETLPCAGL